jgi:hypothetical protein
VGILRDSMDRAGRSPEPPKPAEQAPPTAPMTAAPAPMAPPAAPAPVATAPARGAVPAAAGADGRSELRRRRDALAEQVAEMHWDLGGLAYEMAIRDHFRLDVLVRRAAALQERDAELAEVERLLRSEEDGIAGECPVCRAPHSRGAIYCWQCGATLMHVAPSAALEEQQTVAMDPLLAGPEVGWEGHGAS